MSPWKRAALGGLLGALFVLLLHPESRPFYATGFWKLGDSDYLAKTSYLLGNTNEIGQPENLTQAAYYVLITAEIEREMPGLSKNALRGLIKLCRECATHQQDNAFWPQALAVFNEELGDKAEARRQWALASTKLRWDDLQNLRLQTLLTGLQEESQGPMAWHYAVAYHTRSTALVQIISKFGRDLIAETSLDTPENLILRHETLLNARLLRDGSRSVRQGEFGYELIELTSLPPGRKKTTSQKALVLARGKLFDQFRAVVPDLSILSAQSAFDSNDAWLALVQSQATAQTARDLSIMALLISGLPGALLMVAGTGFLMALLGVAIERTRWLQAIFRTPIAPAFGVVLAVVIFATTGLAIPALWAVLCFAFFAFEPSSPSNTPPEDLGPFFRLILIILGAGFIVVATLFVIGWTAPAIRLIPALGIPREFGAGSLALLGLAGIFLGMVLATAPAWGAFRRYRPHVLAGFALRQFGTGVAIAALFFALIAGPVSMAWERRIQSTLQKLVGNEPTYYLIQ